MVRSGYLKNAAPNYDAIHLCVLRMSWLVKYWLSVVPSGSPDSDVSAKYPIQVPKWDGMGYIANTEVEGGCMMLMRSHPKVTIWPGGFETVKCMCSSGKRKRGGRCTTCVCAIKGSGCSELCRCKLTCCDEDTEESEVQVDDSAEEELEDEDSDSDSHEETLPGMFDSTMESGFSGGVVLGCFQEDDVHEYEQTEEYAWRHDVGPQLDLQPSDIGTSAPLGECGLMKRQFDSSYHYERCFWSELASPGAGNGLYL
ncbi:unnamed protein product [Ectocarpus sp. 4 AP-2014]